MVERTPPLIRFAFRRHNGSREQSPQTPEKRCVVGVTTTREGQVTTVPGESPCRCPTRRNRVLVRSRSKRGATLHNEDYGTTRPVGEIAVLSTPHHQVLQQPLGDGGDVTDRPIEDCEVSFRWLAESADLSYVLQRRRPDLFFRRRRFCVSEGFDASAHAPNLAAPIQRCRKSPLLRIPPNGGQRR